MKHSILLILTLTAAVCGAKGETADPFITHLGSRQAHRPQVLFNTAKAGGYGGCGSGRRFSAMADDGSSAYAQYSIRSLNIMDLILDEANNNTSEAQELTLRADSNETTTERPSADAQTTTSSPSAVDALFERFIFAFDRPYGDDPIEKAIRKEHFIQNIKSAQTLQLGSPLASFGINEFSDEDLALLHERRRQSLNTELLQQLIAQQQNGQLKSEGGGTSDPSTGGSSDGDDIFEGRAEQYALPPTMQMDAEAFRRRFATVLPLADSTPSDDELALPAVSLDDSQLLSDGDVNGVSEEGVRTVSVGARRGMATADLAGYPRSVDWRAIGAVSPVKQQGRCGSCWSFSVTGNVESLWVIAGNNATLLSEEELLACDTVSGNDGCNGGVMQAAFQWILKYRNGYLSKAETYPFTSWNGTTDACNISLSTPGAVIYDWGNIRQNELSLAKAVSSIGPACVGVDSTSWDFYRSGIMTRCTSRNLDHAALVVGFDVNYTVPYWIIKNSWGEEWGEDGYIRVAIGKDLCLVSQLASTTLVAFQANVLPANPFPPESSHAMRQLVTPAVAGVLVAFACFLLTVL